MSDSAIGEERNSIEEMSKSSKKNKHGTRGARAPK